MNAVSPYKEKKSLALCGTAPGLESCLWRSGSMKEGMKESMKESVGESYLVYKNDSLSDSMPRFLKRAPCPATLALSDTNM